MEKIHIEVTLRQGERIISTDIIIPEVSRDYKRMYDPVVEGKNRFQMNGWRLILDVNN